MSTDAAAVPKEANVVEAVLLGMAVMLAGTLPRNFLFAANLTHFPAVSWAVPVTAIYLGFFWWYLAGGGPPTTTATFRRESLRAYRLPARLWFWSLLAGGLAIVALVFALRVVNRLVVLPEEKLPDLANVPHSTVVILLVAAAPIAGVVEEAAFRGYMQGPIERRYGLPLAILVTGTMFAIAHLDFTPILWPYYLAVAAIYGVVTSLARSILPAVVLHTAGNLYSNFDLLRHGRADWQASGSAALIGRTGLDAAFWWSAAAFAIAAGAAAGAWAGLARTSQRTSTIRQPVALSPASRRTK